VSDGAIPLLGFELRLDLNPRACHPSRLLDSYRIPSSAVSVRRRVRLCVNAARSSDRYPTEDDQNGACRDLGRGGRVRHRPCGGGSSTLPKNPRPRFALGPLPKEGSPPSNNPIPNSPPRFAVVGLCVDARVQLEPYQGRAPSDCPIFPSPRLLGKANSFACGSLKRKETQVDRFSFFKSFVP
jgi:hypothetical protein